MKKAESDKKLSAFLIKDKEKRIKKHCQKKSVKDVKEVCKTEMEYSSERENTIYREEVVQREGRHARKRGKME